MSRVLARPLDTRTIALSVAGVLALGTGVLTFNYLASVGHANAPVAQRTVLIAAKAIPAHATVTADMVNTSQRPSSAVDPDAFVVPASAVGGIAVNDIPAGSQLTASKLMRAASSTFPSRVGHGMRAVAIPIDRVKSVSNLIKPGDRVDVIAVTSPRTDVAPKAMTIIRGAKVLSIGQTIDPTTTATPAPESSSQYGSATATLEVSPAQADMLALADINATLRLALRPPDEALRSQPTEKLTFPAGQARPVMPPAAAPMQPQLAPRPAAPPAQPVVKPAPVSAVAVIDGDKVLNPGKAH